MKRPIVALFLAFTTAVAAHATSEMFDFEVLSYRAKMLANAPYAPAAAVPDWIGNLSYDEHRLIQFDASRTLWRREGLPFQVQFFHPGFVLRNTVQVATVNQRQAHPVEFDRKFFNYDRLNVGPLPPTMGFAGLRILYPLNHAEDELGSFLGASYFRFLCQRAVYGLSARGLAINTGAKSPEEFPVFSAFWLERPATEDKSLTVYALLDGESATGAYRFVITPGAETVMEVHARVYFRRAVGRRLRAAHQHVLARRKLCPADGRLPS